MVSGMLAQLVQASTGVLIFQHAGDHPLSITVTDNTQAFTVPIGSLPGMMKESVQPYQEEA